MDSKHTFSQTGIIGGGKFGTTLANLLAQNVDKVLLFVRNETKFQSARTMRKLAGQELAKNIVLTNKITEIGKETEVIFPAVPSTNFRDMIIELRPVLRPYHIMIHGTKGFDLQIGRDDLLQKNQVKTMSEVIREESTIVRIGCISGPNLAEEIAIGLPAATVVSSPFEEVVEIGQKLLRNKNFRVYGGKDLLGSELCGILKNIIAIGAGLVDGLKLGENAKAFLISRGLVEMIHIGQAFGADIKPFLGLAGIGDLIATCGSSMSRNYSVGIQIAKGKKLNQILESLEEIAEGVKTIEVIYRLSKVYDFQPIITGILFKIMFGELKIQDARNFLMKLPFHQEIDFID